jgi:plastocyanin
LRNISRPLAAAALAAAVLAPAAAAEAATKTASLGYAAKPPKGTPPAAAFYAFFPSKITIHKGDKVSYIPAGFGAVYSGPKSKMPTFEQLDASRPVTGLNDPAGNPFWFNGQPTPSVDPAFLAPSGDGKVRKQKDVDMGALPLDDKPKPTVFTFTKPGSYKVYDAVHPKVFQTVVVKPKSAKIPSAAADQKASLKQANKLAKEAKTLAAVKPAPNTILVGNDSKNVGFFQFFPGDATVPANTPITIDAGSSVNDTHNLVIGPAGYMADAAKNVFQPGPAGFDLLASAVYPSQPGTSGLTFDGTQNGGFLSTGAFGAKGSVLPTKTTITFTKPGTYSYVCLFHSNGVYAPGAENMQGTITVQ